MDKYEEVYLTDVFNIYNGRYLSVAIQQENYPITDRYGFRVPTVKVYPSYDVRNKYMGYMDNETFYDMREGWYCIICDFETKSFWKVLIHDIRHLFFMRKRKTSYVNNSCEYLTICDRITCRTAGREQ